MQIWVDADACPGPVREILHRAAERVQVPLLLVANQALKVPPSPFVRAIRVAPGFDEADRHITDNAVAGDIVDRNDVGVLQTPYSADFFNETQRAVILR